MKKPLWTFLILQEKRIKEMTFGQFSMSAKRKSSKGGILISVKTENQESNAQLHQLRKM